MKGVGPATVDVVRELLAAGRSSTLDELREQVPPGLVEMLRIPGLGVAKVRQIHDRLGEVQSIDLSKIPTDRIAYGSTVVLYDLDKEEKVTYELVTSEETKPESGKISTVSPIGQALMGKQEGDSVKVKTPTGIRNFEIARLTTIHEKEDQ